MKTQISWKILIPFVLAPVLAHCLFFFVFFKILAEKQSEEIPFLGLWIFGTLAFWLTFVVIFRAKTIYFEEHNFRIKRIFTRKVKTYKYKEIEHCNVGIEGNQLGTYRVLLIKTVDNKYHSLVSYEINNFNEVLGILIMNKIPDKPISMLKFLKHEYLLPFILATIAVSTLLLILATQ
jgi:hypothetical protein